MLNNNCEHALWFDITLYCVSARKQQATIFNSSGTRDQESQSTNYESHYEIGSIKCCRLKLDMLFFFEKDDDEYNPYNLTIRRYGREYIIGSYFVSERFIAKQISVQIMSLSINIQISISVLKTIELYWQLQATVQIKL